MLVSGDRCFMLHQFALRAATLPGDMAECGVFTGGTAHLIAETLGAAGTGATLHLFDSFAGMPTWAEPSRDAFAPGDFADTSAAMVRARLRPYRGVRFHVGFVPDTFAELDGNARFSFVHADMDLYPSTRAICEWFWPRMVPGGVIVFDDYGFWPLRHAAKAAIDDFFAEQATVPIVLPTGQAVALK